MRQLLIIAAVLFGFSAAADAQVFKPRSKGAKTTKKSSAKKPTAKKASAKKSSAKTSAKKTKKPVSDETSEDAESDDDYVVIEDDPE